MGKLGIAADVKTLDLLNLERTVRALEVQGVEALHFDVSDGGFIPRFGFSLEVIAAVKSITAMPCHVHLLVSGSDKGLPEVLQCGADSVTLQVEACTHIHRALSHIRDFGKEAGIALLPATPLTKINYLFPQVDRLLVLASDPVVRPAGIPRAAQERIRILSENIRYHEYGTTLAVEGALAVEDAARCVRFGTNHLVVGAKDAPGLGDPAQPAALKDYVEQVDRAVHTV